MKSYFYFFCLFFVFACQKENTQGLLNSDGGVRYVSTNILLRKPYVLDYFFNNDHNVTQNITHPNFPLDLQDATINGTYNLYFSSTLQQNGYPDFSQSNKQIVNFIAGKTNFTLGINTNTYANSEMPYQGYIQLTTNNPTKEINKIYTLDFYKRQEFSDLQANNPTGYGVMTQNYTVNATENLSIFSMQYTLSPDLRAALAALQPLPNYQLVYRILDCNGSTTSFKTSAVDILAPLNFTIDISSSVNCLDTSIQAYFVTENVQNYQYYQYNTLAIPITNITIR